MSRDATLVIHAKLNVSRANGPGRRAVIWVKGCSLGCAGCYNPETHAAGGPTETVGSLIDWLETLDGSIEGVSISGGEPLEQMAGLEALVLELRASVPALSVLVFSGFSISEIRRRDGGERVLGLIDVLIDGRYLEKLHHGRELRGSKNQRIHCLTDRYTIAQVMETPATEVSIAPDGSLILTGVSPLDVESPAE